MNIFKISKVKFKYNKGKYIFNNLSAEIEHNKITAIIGPNGSGKTTLLYLMAGLLKPIDGEILFFNKNLNNYKKDEMAQKIGILFSDYQFAYNYTVWEFILMGRYPYKNGFLGFNDDDFRIVENAMNRTGVQKFKTRGIMDLSTGERQLVLLAHLLAQDPEVLLLDEPFSHLDLKHQFNIIDILKNINKSVIFVTHNISYIDKVADRTILLKDGNIYYSGIPKSALRPGKIKTLFDISDEKF